MSHCEIYECVTGAQNFQRISNFKLLPNAAQGYHIVEF